MTYTSKVTASTWLLVSVLSLILPIQAKRHSLHTKTERYERRARQAAQANTTLANVLSKQTKSMTFEEAQTARDYYRSKQEDVMVIKCGERILAVGGDQEVLRLTRLELAELFLKKKDYKNTEKHAQDYLLYYPGTRENKRASFIALQASFRSQHAYNRDQEKTRSTIEMGHAFLEKYPEDTDSAKKVNEMLTASYLKLIRSELSIITTHLHTYSNTKNQGHLTAAQKRITHLKNTLLTHAPSAQKRVNELEAQVQAATILETPKADSAKNAEPAPIKLALSSHPVPSESWYKRAWSSAKDAFYEDNEAFFARASA